jgi:hypothetical protein
MKTFIITILTIFLMGGCVARSSQGVNPHYSDGVRAGTVTKLSNKGLIWKSWEGELLVGGMRESSDGKSMVPNIMEFNVSDPSIIEKLQSAIDSGQKVVLTYNQWFISPIWIENDHVIVSIK